jgi:uncharacterized protein YcbK (DUF882 family)
MENIKYFKKNEFDCTCCGFNNIKYNLVYKLDIVRTNIQTALIVNSGCRCKKYNKLKNGKDDSSHLYGEAVDIKCTNSRLRYKLIKELINVGFTRIGIAKTFIHGDISKNKSQQVIWVY